jgi:hypothetical protein
MIRSVLRRVLRSHFPPPPVAAALFAPSMVFSPEDEPYPPTDRLISLAIEAVERARTISLAGLIGERPNMPSRVDLWPGEHYRLLAGLVAALQPEVVVEIGTFTGISALAMLAGRPSVATLATFDIVPWDSRKRTCLTQQDFAGNRLVDHVADLSVPDVVAAHQGLLRSADFIFIDAGPHDGAVEAKIVANLGALTFDSPPVLMFDDTRLWSMLRFWRELALPKLDLTSFGHWSGTGLAEWVHTESGKAPGSGA